MSAGVMLVFSAPASDEVRADYDDWYDNTHIPEMRKAVPAITDVRRYVLNGPVPPTIEGRDRLAIYTVEDVAAAQSDIAAAASGFTKSDALQRNPPVLVVFYDEPA